MASKTTEEQKLQKLKDSIIEGVSKSENIKYLTRIYTVVKYLKED